MTKDKKKLLRVLLWALAGLAALALILGGVYHLFLDPYRGTDDGNEPGVSLDTVLTREQALEDLDYLHKMVVSRHPVWLDGSDELAAAFEARYQLERAAITDDVTALELWRACGRTTALLHDGHTRAQLIPPEQLYIADFTALRQEDASLVAVNGVSCSDIVRRAQDLYPCETDDYAKYILGNMVCCESWLRALDIDMPDSVVYTFEREDGTTYDTSTGFAPFEETNYTELEEAKGTNTEDFVYWRIDEEHNTGVFTLDECINDEHYRETLREFFKAVEENGCRSVIVDLRDNGGGNSMVADEFIRCLDADSYRSWACAVRYGDFLRRYKGSTEKNRRLEPSFDGDVYVLTDTDTFSAAMDFAMLIEDNDLGTLIGEPSGNRPDSYGDCLSFRLPNSGISLTVSYKRWYRIDQSKAHELIEPDVPCDSAEALDVAFGLIEKKTGLTPAVVSGSDAVSASDNAPAAA